MRRASSALNTKVGTTTASRYGPIRNAMACPTTTLAAPPPRRAAAHVETATRSGPGVHSPRMLLALACASQCPCDAISATDAPVTDEAGLVTLLEAARREAWPELTGLAIEVQSYSDLAYFRALPTPDTLGVTDPADRHYLVQYDPVVLADPPAATALAAVLVHELAHVADYTAMTAEELLEFGLWYATEDPMSSDELRDYERQTDEAALSRGCAEGLSAMRTWIYDHASEEVEAEKRRNYYSPEEITEWVAANGECAP